MRPRLFPLLLLMFVCSGCATDRTKYTVTPGGPLLAPNAAQDAILAMKLGQQIKPPLDAPLEVLAAPLPGYPRDFIRANLEGTVRLRFWIEPDGTVSNVEVIGSPPAPLAAISVIAILQWKFSPPKRDGQPVKQLFYHEFIFRLEG